MEVSKKKRIKAAVKTVAFSGAAAACIAAVILAAVLLSGNKGAGLNSPAAEAPSVLNPPAQTSSAVAMVTPDKRVVAVSSGYGGNLSSYITPGPGKVLITEEVRQALEDEKNKGAYFFVQIYIIPPEQYANTFKDYVFNGYTIAQWSEFVDLSKGEYPYSEYNGDHGGNITKEEFRELQRQAKTLNAQENFDAARAEYDKKIEPLLFKARREWEQNEAARLKTLGYDVFMMDTWTYKGAGEKENRRVLAGVLSEQQIAGFSAGSDCGYSIEWVHNGDGVLDWEEYKAENTN